MRTLILLLLFTVSIFAQNSILPDSARKTAVSADTTKKTVVLPVVNKTDTVIPGSLLQKADTTIATIKDSSVLADSGSGSKCSSVKSKAVIDSVDSTRFNGFYMGIGAGVSLGTVEALRMWEKTLPDSLKDFGLLSGSFSISPDTASSDSLTRLGDTSGLRFSIKEKPAIYNLSVPLTLSITKFRERSHFTSALTFSLFSKTQKGSIYVLNDSLDRRVDIRQKFMMYSLTLNFLYGTRINPRYFSIDGVDRTNFMLGVGITPLVSMNRTFSTKRHSDDIRIRSIEDSISSLFKDKHDYGFAANVKTGITTQSHLAKGGIEVGLFYTLSWYNYFLNDGDRVYRRDLNPSEKDADKPLSFISNRVELTITLIRPAKKTTRSQ